MISESATVYDLRSRNYGLYIPRNAVYSGVSVENFSGAAPAAPTLPLG